MSLLLMGAGKAKDTATAFTPASLSPDIWAEAALSFQDSGTTPATALNDPVFRMQDKRSGGTRHFDANPGSGVRPLYQPNSGKPYNKWDGVDDQLGTFPAFALPDATGQHWVGIAARLNSLSGDQRLWAGTDQSTTDISRIWVEDTTGIVKSQAFNGASQGIDSGSAVVINTPFTVIMQITTTTIETFVNGVSTGGPTTLSGQSTNVTSGYFYLGSYSASVSLNGGIYGAIGKGGLIGSNLSNVHNYLIGLTA